MAYSNIPVCLWVRKSMPVGNECVLENPFPEHSRLSIISHRDASSFGLDVFIEQ